MLVASFSCFLNHIISWSLKVPSLWSFILWSPHIWLPKCPILLNKAKLSPYVCRQVKILLILAIHTCRYFLPNFFQIILQIDRNTVKQNFCSYPPNWIIQDIQPESLSRYVRHELQFSWLWNVFLETRWSPIFLHTVQTIISWNSNPTFPKEHNHGFVNDSLL